MRVLDTLSILLARIVLLGNGEVHEKTYTFIAVNLEAFKHYMMRVSASSLHRKSTDSLILNFPWMPYTLAVSVQV